MHSYEVESVKGVLRYVSCKKKKKHSYDYGKGLLLAGGVETVSRLLSRPLKTLTHTQAVFFYDSR